MSDPSPIAFLQRAFHIQAGEGARVGIMFIYSAAAMGGVLTVGLVVAESLFMSQLPTVGYALRLYHSGHLGSAAPAGLQSPGGPLPARSVGARLHGHPGVCGRGHPSSSRHVSRHLLRHARRTVRLYRRRVHPGHRSVLDLCRADLQFPRGSPPVWAHRRGRESVRCAGRPFAGGSGPARRSSEPALHRHWLPGRMRRLRTGTGTVRCRFRRPGKCAHTPSPARKGTFTRSGSAGTVEDTLAARDCRARPARGAALEYGSVSIFAGLAASIRGPEPGIGGVPWPVRDSCRLWLRLSCRSSSPPR